MYNKRQLVVVYCFRTRTVGAKAVQDKNCSHLW